VTGSCSAPLWASASPQLGRVPVETATQVHLFTAFNWTLLVIDALVGLRILRRQWHRATALTPADEGPPVSADGSRD
jgi:hypothetical protein